MIRNSRPVSLLVLMLLAVGLQSTEARVTINMTAAADYQASMAALAAGAASTVTANTAPTAAAVQQAAATTTNSLQKALAQLMGPNGTHKVNITLPKLPGLQPRSITVPKVLQKTSDFSFNITLPKLLNLSSVGASGSNSSAIKKDTLKMASNVLQQLAQLQPSLAKLDAVFKNLNINAGTSPTARSLLEDDDAPASANVPASDGAPAMDDAPAVDEVSVDPAATMRALLEDNSAIGVTSTDTTKTAAEILNSKKFAQKVNLGMSDGWLVLYSGFKVAQASVQLLAALLRAGTTGVVSVDPALLLSFADLGSNFSAAVGYLMYSVQKTAADMVAPTGIKKPTNA